MSLSDDLPAGKVPDYLGRADLLHLDLSKAATGRLLRGSPITGHDNQPVVEAERLTEWSAPFESEWGGQ
jgi:hypothetical protein